MARTGLIYGESGTFKTTQIGTLARYIYRRTGKPIRLISADLGGWGPIQQEIDAGLIIPVHGNLRQFLDGLPAREVDAVVLLDSQDWMSPEEIRTLWDAIDRAGSNHVSVIFRTAGANSPLEEGEELAPLREIWRRDDERSDIGFALDRSGIYGGFHCYVRR